MNHRTFPTSHRFLFLLGSLGLLAGACAASGGGPASPGAAGTSAGGTTGAAGAAGAAGMTGAAGAAGTTGAAGAGMAGAAGTTGVAGTMGAAGTTGVAGTGGAGGAGGGAGTTGAAGAGTASKPSVGCGMAPPSSDSSKTWVKHDVMVTGVDPAFVTKYPPNAGTTYNWTKRNYFMRLPTGYDPAKPYFALVGTSGCGGPETVGAEGGYSPLGTAAGETQAVQIALSYVLSSAANSDCGGAVFADDFVNTPEPAYLEAVVKDVAAQFCIDQSKVFLSGYSSGAFETITLGCTDNDILRGIGVQIGGGLRIKHPPCKNNPMAAMFVVGLQDTENPIGPLTTPLHDSLGTAPARDEILTRNGCTNQDHAPWDPTYPMCEKYTGCPAKYPVVWCAITSGHLPMPNDPAVGKYRYEGVWKFWSTLP